MKRVQDDPEAGVNSYQVEDMILINERKMNNSKTFKLPVLSITFSNHRYLFLSKL